MKRLVLALVALSFSGVAVAQSSTWVKGYVRKDGTYVEGHMRTRPNSTTSDNWTTRGNVNPYTGQRGTRSPDTAPSPSRYRYKAPCYYNCPK